MSQSNRALAARKLQREFEEKFKAVKINNKSRSEFPHGARQICSAGAELEPKDTSYSDRFRIIVFLEKKKEKNKQCKLIGTI